jgi:hypothetical protein
MTIDFPAWADRVRQLDAALAALRPVAATVGVEPPDRQEWFELLRLKLLPQLEEEPLLIVAIVGGTNIGKSVLFNHLASDVASGMSPLAAGTKHPVCLVPPGTSDPGTLTRLFEDFRLVVWESPEDPLRECADNMLYWRVGDTVPPRLLLVDAPDVDSDVTVNWDRARAIRQAADVLVAVLTQQKYNDAAVKQFFREAARADKPIVAVFNQCDLERDLEYWPQWLATFAAETGAAPELVYVVPHDREAAESLRLPFYDVGRNARRSPTEPSSLREELAALHFDAIKIRTFRGALGRVLDSDNGAAGYLAKIRASAGEFSAAAEALSAAEMARVAWPTLPPGVLVDEIRNWWGAGRKGWSRGVHNFYRKVGRGVTWPVRAAWRKIRPQAEQLEPFRRRESEAIILAVEKMVDELDRLARVGNDTLRPRLLKLLSGHARQQLLERVKEAHDELPAVDDDYRAFLREELDTWRQSNPRVVRFLRSLDHVLALARPAITISLAFSGFVLAGDLVGEAAVQAAGHTAGGLATEAAIAGGITGGGEAAISTAGEGVRHAAARLFGRLQTRYAQQRADWLARWLEQELLGGLLAELREGAGVPDAGAFRGVEKALEALRPTED